MDDKACLLAAGSVKYRNMAQFLETTTSGGQTVAIDCDDFYLSFSILLAK
jgi:hypothetical protein